VSATDLAAIAVVTVAYVIALVVIAATFGRAIRRLDRTVRILHDTVDDLFEVVERLRGIVFSQPPAETPADEER
jgi:hypothetical protein